MVSRRMLVGGGLAVAAIGGFAAWAYPQLRTNPAEVGFDLTSDELAAALAFLDRHPAIDSHAHPGRTFVRGAKGLNWKLWLYQQFGTFEDRVVDDMKAGKLAAASFSGVSDFPVLGLSGEGLASIRAFAPGEALAYYQAQIVNLRGLVESGLVHPVLAPADVEAARAAGKPGAIFAVEGGDFVEDDPARMAQAFTDGVRMVTLVHYLAGGKIGDIMTAPPVHGGLTPLGKDVVAAMNAAGIMLDLSHASEKTAFGALAVNKGPAVATHTHLNSLGIGHPRFISDELAQAIAATGGYIGAWPAGIGIASLAGFIDRIEQLVGKVGIDHVAIGSDMDANYKPVFETYRKTPLIVGALMKRGMAEADIAKIIGGNFQRVFAATLKAVA
ncbi:MAG: membrane dipeptidase [Phyllobacteriaceae bacterium]|nr:membrane dipeptidase [Phyllobacteriaceae bacterium]